MALEDAATEDAKLIDALVRMQRAESAWMVADAAGVDRRYAEEALARMADEIPAGPDYFSYPLMRRRDLGADWYEPIELEREGGGVMARRRSFTSQLYRAARISNNISSLSRPTRAARRAKNLALGRGLSKAGVWRRLWK